MQCRSWKRSNVATSVSRAWWHWFFFAQSEKPERAICADPLAWYAASPEKMGEENHADFVVAVSNPAVVHGMLEDYRAGLEIDREHDRTDRAAARRLTIPTLVLWSRRVDLEELYGDVLGIWRGWADEVSGHGIDLG